MNNIIDLPTKQKRIIITILIFFIALSSMQTTVYAHRAYFLQTMIDEGQMLYIGNVIKESTLKESNKTEPELWNFEGNFNYGSPEAYKEYEDGSNDGKSSMFFTFPPKPFKDLGVLKSNNNATTKDSNRVYEILDTLIPNLNELLLILNEGEKYETTEELIRMSEKLIGLYASGRGSIQSKNENYTISYDDSIYMNVLPNSGDGYKVLVKMKKGYKEPLLEKLENEKNAKKSPLYNSDLTFEEKYYSDEISIASMALQANYTYVVKGHSAADASEYSKPGTLELKMSEFLGSTITSLRSLLGLRDISELVYNQGIVGSSMYYNGVMPKTWMESAVKFHMIFQALTWIALVIAIVKLLFKKNLSTVNSAMRVSLIDGIKDLLIAGFMLIAIFLIINAMLAVNEKIVGVFATTIPIDYSAFTGGNVDFASFAGVLLQLYYLIITIYLNFLYIIRAISTAILIASAPFFIASIAFEGKNKKLFESWARELTTNIFMQSFHAFILSFVLSAQMTAMRGIELAVISFALIPMTNWFRTLITGNSGNFTENIGLAGVTMGASAVGSIAGGISGRGKSSSKYKGSNNSGNSNIKTKDSDNIPGVGENPGRKEHSINTPKKNQTSKAISKLETDFNETNPNNAEDNYTKLSKKAFKNTGNFSKDDIGKTVKDTAIATIGIAAGGAKVATGAAMGLVLGVVGGGKAGFDLMNSGASNLARATKTVGITAGEFAKRGINAGATKISDIRHDSGGNILGAEELDNGDIAVHRDRQMLEKDGLQDIKRTNDKNVAITYDKDNLNKDNKEYLGKIEGLYNDKKFDYLQERGIDKVAKTENGNTVVHYNGYGQEQLGYKDVYKNKSRIVETKSPGQPLKSNIIYDVKGTNPIPPKNISENNNYIQPTDSGESIHIEHKDRKKTVGMDDIIT